MNSTRKRVILLVSSDLSTDNRVHKMATTLSLNNFDVLVVGRKLRSSFELTNDVIYARKRLRFVFNKGALFYAEMNIRFCLFLLFHRFDIATANDLDTLLGTWVAVRIKRKEIVYDSHEYFTEVPELQDRPRIQNVWLRIERFIFPKLKQSITVCESIAKLYEEMYHVPVSVVRNLPNRGSVSQIDLLEHQESSKIILYQGAVNLGRGLEMTIEAMKYIDNAKLLIVGTGDKIDELKLLANRLGLSEKIVFVGKVPLSELPNYTRLATIGISLEEDLGLNYRYALPNKLFDYIYAMKPVLVSNLPEMKNIILQYGCGEIVTQRTPKSLANQISEMINNEQKRNQYRKNCAIAANELCWEREEKTILKIYGDR